MLDRYFNANVYVSDKTHLYHRFSLIEMFLLGIRNTPYSLLIMSDNTVDVYALLTLSVRVRRSLSSSYSFTILS